ncbi:MAG: transglycosylase SLT domain-containing protein [Candidatus Hydrogenedens sp.]|nr:transglycosylase SLT domain-containing protein [Candidatus Hydrogenedens sp.]
MLFSGIALWFLAVGALAPAEQLFLEADSAQKAGRFADAGKLFEECASASEELRPYAWSRLGWLHTLRGQTDKGLTYFNEVLRHFPEGPWIRLTRTRLADAHSRAGRRQEAYEAGDKAFQGLPVHPWFMNTAAWLHVDNCLALPAHRTEAYAYCRHVVETTILIAQRKKATEYLLESFETEDRLRGIFGLIRSGNVTDGRKRFDLEKALSTDVLEHVATLNQLDLLSRHTEVLTEEKRGELERLVRSLAGSFEGRVWMMLSLREQAIAGRAALAEYLCLLFARYFPEGRDSGDGYWWMSERYERAGDLAGADRMYRGLASQCPDHVRAPRSRYNLANRAKASGKNQEAQALYELLGEEHPDTPFTAEGYYRCAQMARAAGNRKAEEDWLRRAASVGIGYFHAYRARQLLAERSPEEGRGGTRIHAPAGQSFLLAPPVTEKEGQAPVLLPLISSKAPYRRIAFFGNHGLEEGDWEALDLILTSPPSLKKLWFPVIADGGFMRTLSQFMNTPELKEDASLTEEIRRKLEYPRAYWDQVKAVARPLDLDPYLLLAVARQESVFCATIASHAGATGVMQLMPGTADWLAKVDSRILPSHASNLERPGNSLQLGAVYLQRMLKRSDGNVIHALASYNAGPGNCDKWRARFPNLGSEAFMEAIPFTETRDYVHKVLANYAAYRSLYPPVH